VWFQNDHTAVPVHDISEVPYILCRIFSLSQTDSDDCARALSVHLLARVGGINHEVEELHEGQVTLEKALRLVREDATEFKDLIIVPELVCANQVMN
jgi:hypothetical protein